LGFFTLAQKRKIGTVYRRAEPYQLSDAFVATTESAGRPSSQS
jgi:hypothetical protein